MKTANIKSTLILSIAIAAAVVTSAYAFQAGNAVHSSKQTATAGVATVVITGKRMSEEEKIAYDTQDSKIQTVVVTAKRLSAEQKLAMDKEDAQAFMIAKAARGHHSA